MRNLSTACLLVSTVVFTLAGCAYDAELMGELEPEPIEGLEHIALPEDPPYSEAASYQEIEYQLAETPVEFVAPEHEAIYSPVDSLDMFADLRFFGSWYYHDQFEWVWRPTVSRVWAPMTQGYWAWTENDWMWVTHDQFGSDPYNYGYWVEDTALGWVWVPDCTWQPLRCQWTQWDNYVAWAPLLPPDEGEYRDPWQLDSRDTPWVTVRLSNFMKHDVIRYKIPPKFNRSESEQTIVRGPVDIERLEKVLGRRIERVHIPWRQPPILPVIVEVPVEIDDGWMPIVPIDPRPCPPGLVPIPLPDPPVAAPREDPGKMKEAPRNNNPPPAKSEPRPFKKPPDDPPSGKGKSKAK